MGTLEERQLHAVPGFLRLVNAVDHFNRPPSILFIAARLSIALNGSNQIGHHQRIRDLVLGVPVDTLAGQIKFRFYRLPLML
jgi:hypothetical protein